MTNPNQEPKQSELEVSVSPERKGFFSKIKDLGVRAVEQVVELTPGALAMAGEIVDKTKDEIEKRTPEIRGQVERIAGAVADKAVEGYDAVSDSAQEVWQRRDELITPATEFATKAYDEVIKPIGGDVLTAVGKEYGIEYNNKLKVSPTKFGRGILGIARNPVGALTGAARIAKKTATRSSAKMFVS